MKRKRRMFGIRKKIQSVLGNTLRKANQLLLKMNNLSVNIHMHLANQQGQATLESTLVWLVLAAIMLGFAALLNRLGAGLFVLHALRSASHSFGYNTAGSIGDVFIY